MGSSMSRNRNTTETAPPPTPRILMDGEIKIINPIREIDCTGLSRLPPLPSYVKYLILRNANSLQTLQPLPPQLQSLCIYNSPDFPEEEYAALPETLTELSIVTTPLSDIRKLPQWIKNLWLSNTHITEIPPGLFPHLTKLHIKDDKMIQTICIPENVNRLYIDRVPTLHHIVSFSEKTTEIVLNQLPSLTELPPFPMALLYIKVSNVPLTRLPPFPHTKVYVGLFRTNLPKEILYGKFHDDSQQTYDAEWIKNVNPTLEEMDSQHRIQKRCRLFRSELLAAAHNPDRVAKWLGEGDWELVDMMLGVA